MNEDMKFLQDQIENEAAALPESLREAAVAELVSGEAQAKPKKRRYRTVIVSLAAALAILIGVTFAVKLAGKAPRVFRSQPEQAADTAQPDYTAIATLLENRAKEREKDTYQGGWFGNFSLKGGRQSYDAAPAEAPAVGYDDSYRGAVTANESSLAEASEQSYSGLNTRTEGVDETETVRTDGRFIYVLSHYYDNYYYYYYGWAVDEIAADDAETDIEENEIAEAAPADSDPAESRTAETAPEEPEPAEPETAEAASAEQRIGQRFTVVDPNGGNMQTVSVTELSPLNAEDGVRKARYFEGFYLYGNYAVLTGRENVYHRAADDGTDTVWDYGYSYRYFYPYYYLNVQSRGLVCIYDLSDPANVTLTKELWFDSDIVDTRISEGRLVTVSTYYPYAHDFKADDYTTFVPCAGDAYVAPDCIYVADEDGEEFFTVTVTDLDGGFTCESVSVLGYACDFYYTGKNIYAYASQSEYKGPVTGWVDNLQIYKITADGAKPEYIAKTQLESAWLRDDYSIDEYNGMVRLALQCWSGDNIENYIVILDGSLNVLGQTAPFGAGENIQSVRFSENLCYAVTFYQMDPLFVFDLSDPANPVKRGELKLPGFSSYMHPVGEGYMVGVGRGGTDEGLDGSAKISLFNVADPENPVEVDQFTLPDGWFNEDHKAFITRGENGFIVTFTCWKDNGSDYGALYFTVENGRLVQQSRCLLQGGWTNETKALFIGDVLYMYAQWYDYNETKGSYDDGERLYAFNIDSGDQIGMLDL